MSKQASICSSLYKSLKAKYEADYIQAETTLLIYFNNPVGIGEHPQHIEEMDKLITKMVDANDKLQLLQSKFDNIWL